jgi:hypothetical protein
MLVASLGTTTAVELGLAEAVAGESPERLTFGSLEPLVSLMQETPPDKLLPLAVKQLEKGTQLKTLVAAAALANARAFGGQDYTGYHTFMALTPAYHMSRQLPEPRQALPVLKVLYRNSSRIQEQGAGEHDTLHVVDALEGVEAGDGQSLRQAVRSVDWEGAERRFAAQVKQGPVGEAFNHLQFTVQDEVNVHRIVLAWRAWAMMEVCGQQHAHSLLRQSLRFCLDTEQAQHNRNLPGSAVREILPRLLDQYHLLSRPLGQRRPDDAWIEHLADTMFSGSRQQAAEAAAAALAEGMEPEAIGQAMSLAANRLVLHDPGRKPEHSSPEKPPGCVHGDSVGVHASDAANAWRNISRISNPRNTIASLIVGAFHTAGQVEQVSRQPYYNADAADAIETRDPAELLEKVDQAIATNDQALACAVVHRYGQLGGSERPLLDLLLRYAVSEDGALHAEKYYRTVCEEFATTRPALRWGHLVALARVTASEHGFAAPGYAEACRLLGVETT